MADKKISQLNILEAVENDDLIVVVDSSTSETKKATIESVINHAGESFVKGTGTLNKLAKFTENGNVIGNSQIYDNGSAVGIGTNIPNEKLHVIGNVKISDLASSETKMVVADSNGVLGIQPTPDGDMQKSVYDTNNNGIVDKAEEATLALNANHAATADSATEAVHSQTAESANTATTAELATLALNANHATTADTATEATHSESSNSADTATVAGNIAGTPGVNKYYGTNSSGTKGFFDLPTGGSGGVVSLIPNPIVDLQYYDDGKVKLKKEEVDTNKYFEARFSYFSTGNNEGQVEFAEVKDDISMKWIKIQYNYSTDSPYRLSTTTHSDITAWTII